MGGSRRGCGCSDQTFSLRVDIDLLWSATEEDLKRHKENAAEYFPVSYVPSLVIQNAASCDVSAVAGASGSPYTIENELNFVRIRVYGTFISRMEVGMFPFDSHELSVHVTLAFKSAKEVVFAPEKLDHDCMYVVTEFNAIQDWEILGCNLTAYVDEGDFPFAFLKGTICVRRIPWSFLFKQMLSVTLTTGLGLAGFQIADKTSRLNYYVLLLLTIIGIQFAIASVLPPSAYMSIADKLLLSCMAFTIGLSAYSAGIDVDDNGNVIDLNSASYVAYGLYGGGCCVFTCISVMEYQKHSRKTAPTMLKKKPTYTSKGVYLYDLPRNKTVTADMNWSSAKSFKTKIASI